jgi:hypothetical protein
MTHFAFIFSQTTQCRFYYYDFSRSSFSVLTLYFNFSFQSNELLQTIATKRLNNNLLYSYSFLSFLSSDGGGGSSTVSEKRAVRASERASE